MARTSPAIQADDALLVVDVQNDFLPGGALAVREGDQVIPVLNTWIEAFERTGQPIFATRDWHPPDHCSFKAQGGPWPPHCIAGSAGAQFAAALRLPPETITVSKAQAVDRDAYSGFAGTDLGDQLRAKGIKRVWIGGLTTDYCVVNTVLDAVAAGFEVLVLGDAIRAVEVNPGDGAAALECMRSAGAEIVASDLGD